MIYLFLQQYVQKFMELQEACKATSENTRKEHQCANKLVNKLKEDNNALKLELEKLHIQFDQVLMKEGKEDLEEDNKCMKQQIKAFQEQIETIDVDLKNSEVNDVLQDTQTINT